MSNALDPKTNFAVVEALMGYAAGVTSISLASGDGALLPQPSTDGAFNLTWYNATDYTSPHEDPNVEIVRVTARSTDALTITRAQEGTADSAHNAGGKTYRLILGLTKKDWADAETELDRLDEKQKELLTATGTANALIATPTTAWTAYTSGHKIWVKPASANTGAATINVSGLGTKAIVDRAGNALQAGDLKTGVPVLLVYDGTSMVMGASEVDKRQVAKAWVKLSHVAGVPTAQESFNVASLTDNGTGDVTINFTTSMSAATYAYTIDGAASGVTIVPAVTAQAAASMRFVFYNLVSNQDVDYAAAIFYGAR